MHYIYNYIDTVNYMDLSIHRIWKWTLGRILAAMEILFAMALSIQNKTIVCHERL